MKPIIKWPGGKTGEISRIERMIPPHERYIEPFFGGGALYFHLQPEKALINDISTSLMEFYEFVQKRDQRFFGLLHCYRQAVVSLLAAADQRVDTLLGLFELLKAGNTPEATLKEGVADLAACMIAEMDPCALIALHVEQEKLKKHFTAQGWDKLKRTLKNHQKKPFSKEDLKENLITGFVSGLYMYFRAVFNDLQLGRMEACRQFKAANFYFIREYCYGSMFRYNKNGEFNIPYGGMTYNRKNFKAKIDAMAHGEMEELLKNTGIFCEDFESFLQKAELTQQDFLFIDPPYDTDFSDYEGRDFSKNDHLRLAECLKTIPAAFLMIIKNTDYIRSLYEQHFYILQTDKRYTYNVRSRNERKSEHLIVTNYPVPEVQQRFRL